MRISDWSSDVCSSPVNVHINRNPVSGRVSFFRYHAGKYLVAWHPKSSTLNERTSIAVPTATGKEILFRQIAGAMARRIVWYVAAGSAVTQGEEFEIGRATGRERGGQDGKI